MTAPVSAYLAVVSSAPAAAEIFFSRKVDSSRVWEAMEREAMRVAERATCFWMWGEDFRVVGEILCMDNRVICFALRHKSPLYVASQTFINTR